MPLLASNFTSNSLSGTVVVSGGQANIQLPLTAFAFEGQKTFVVKLRRDSNTGSIVGVSNTITILDTSTIVSLTANISTVSEGNAITYTLTTANVPNGTNVYYTTNSIVTANVDSSDFTTGNTGVLTINNNLATITLITAADNTLVDESGETFALQIRTNNTAGNVVITSSNVLILDTSTQYNVSKLAESVGSVTEGGTITLTLTANVPGGTIMYYDTTGNVSTTNFTTGNTGSFVMNGSSNTITLVTTSTVPYATQADFRVRVKRDSLNGTTLITSNNLLIYDAALTQLQATGGTIAVASGYKTHTFTSSGTFNVTSIASYPGYAEYLILAGGGAGGTASYDPAVGTGAGTWGGGGGAGGFLEGNITIPAIGTYTANVGAGGSSTGAPGSNSSILGLTALGGGGGSSYGPNFTAPGGVTIFQATAAAGGSGGGGNRRLSGGAGTPGQGYPGGSWTQSWPGTTYVAASGGGGAGGAGEDKVNPVSNLDRGTMGGAARLSNITGTYLGGGGGSAAYGLGPYGWGGGQPPASPAKGGGGDGSQTTPAASAGTGGNNTGGGGGGGGAGITGAPYAPASAGGSGGSGIVVIRYPFTGQYFSNLVANTSSTLMGSNISFVLTVLNANATTLYYSTTGNANSSHFIGGNTGSFIANTSGATIVLQTNVNSTLDVSKTFALQVRQDSPAGQVSITSGNVILINGIAVSYLLVGGGGSGQATDGSTVGGGGGGGGITVGNTTLTPGVTYAITIGTGYADGAIPSQNGYPGWYGGYGGGDGSWGTGQQSAFIGGSVSLTANGGGGGGSFFGSAVVQNGKGGSSSGQTYLRTNAAIPGGSGGGAGQQNPFSGNGGNPLATPSLPGGEAVSPGSLAGGTGGVGGSGYPGGNTTLGGNNGSAGGGGAGGAGQPDALGGNGGAAYQWMDGNWYAGGGAGKSGGFGGGQPPANLAMKGGGGDFTSGSPPTSPGSGVVNTGGGGGAAVSKTYPGIPVGFPSTPQSAGGPGIVVIRYPNTKPLATATTGSNTIVYANANIYYRFTSPGTITF